MTEMKTQRLVMVQVAIAILAVAVTGFSFYQLIPLTEEKIALNAQISSLKATRDELKRDVDAFVKTAKPVGKSAENLEAWLYVGRSNSSGKWAPPSEGVIPSPESSIVQGFQKIATTKNATLVGNPESASSSTTSKSIADVVQLVQAGTELSVLELKTQPSIGDGLLVWAKVSVPSDRVLEIANK